MSVVACCTETNECCGFPWYNILFNFIFMILQVAEELCFRIHAECSLTEPFVANMISRILPSGHALFIGNSMVIRDVDMYGHNWQKFTGNIGPVLLNSKLQYQSILVAGNRGASGIDGLVSTAIGFAMGSNKQVSIHTNIPSSCYSPHVITFLSRI